MTDNKYAFPIITPDMNTGSDGGPGMTKREYAAIHICAQLVRQYEMSANVHHTANAAVMQADALLKALEQE